MNRILFVCHGNICRSAAAEMVLRQKAEETAGMPALRISSAAATREEIGNDIYPPMKKALQAAGYVCHPHSARQTTREDYRTWDYIIGMDVENMEDMLRIYGGDPEGKLSLLMDWAGRPGQEIDDPWYTRDFRGALRQIEEGCDGLLQYLRNAAAPTYYFSGRKDRIPHAVTAEYPGIDIPHDLYQALLRVWSAETCAPRMRGRWTKANPTLGQCSITAFLAQDIFGGKVYGIPLPEGGYHCYNEVNGYLFDLTSAQFGEEKLCYAGNPEQFREEHFKKEEKRERYNLLKERLARMRGQCEA